jgi:hypothetical protein
MIFHVIGDLFTDGRQFKHLVLDGRIVGLLSQLQIHDRLVAEIVSPIHVCNPLRGVDNHKHETGGSFLPKSKAPDCSEARVRRGTSARTDTIAPMEKLGANPNDHQRHRKADTQRATNRQRECRKQIVFGLNLTSGHGHNSIEPPGAVDPQQNN